jgi:geranylgeranylglycerol-phosphate geranylgeranyltransferase
MKINLFQIFKFSLGLMSIVNINAFVNINKLEPFQKRVSIMYNNPLPPIEPIGPFDPFKNKINGLIKLTRPSNILPTLLLNISGGWIMNPSFNNLIHSLPFIASAASTVLILMSSMIINDIYDCKLDEANYPSRPIASGQIKIYEAVALSLFLVGSSEYINIHFLPENLQLIVHLSIINIILYTPILKKIPLIKNISCAALITFAIFFSGLASNNNSGLIIENKNFELLATVLNIIFYGSLSNEILHDIRDYEGDKMHNIYTIPVIFGKDVAWIFSKVITNLSVMSNALVVYYLTDFTNGLLFALICSPLSFNLYKLKSEGYTKENIEKVTKDTQIPMIFVLLYFCLLSFQSV